MSMICKAIGIVALMLGVCLTLFGLWMCMEWLWAQCPQIAVTVLGLAFIFGGAALVMVDE